jgi:hypothetical protein
MTMHLGKFIHTKTGNYLMAFILGLGLASLFRQVCKNGNCLHYYAPPLEQITGKPYKIGDKCVKYTPQPIKCENGVKILPFE